MLADDLIVQGDARILITDAALETLWEEGGFTEGAAAGPDGNMYFSDFAQPFESGPARVMKFDTGNAKLMLGNFTADAMDFVVAKIVEVVGGI